MDHTKLSITHLCGWRIPFSAWDFPRKPKGELPFRWGGLCGYVETSFTRMCLPRRAPGTGQTSGEGVVLVGSTQLSVSDILSSWIQGGSLQNRREKVPTQQKRRDTEIWLVSLENKTNTKTSSKRTRDPEILWVDEILRHFQTMVES